jgi:hypothetical protein
MWPVWRQAMNAYLIFIGKEHLENREKVGSMTVGLLSERWIPTFRKNILPPFSGWKYLL